VADYGGRRQTTVADCDGRRQWLTMAGEQQQLVVAVVAVSCSN